MVGELRVNRYKLLPLEGLSNEILLCSTENCLDTYHRAQQWEKKIMYTCMCNSVSMLYSRKKNCIWEVTIKKIKKKK